LFGSSSRFKGTLRPVFLPRLFFPSHVHLLLSFNCQYQHNNNLFVLQQRIIAILYVIHSRVSFV
jgi:hypothetical protein